jgi:hypothetical protein
MSDIHDIYKQIALPSGYTLEPCPVCSSKAELWQFSESDKSPTQKLVCCTQGEPIGPQDGLIFHGCLLYMPPDIFMRPTISDAVKYWNEFAVAIREMRLQHESKVSGSTQPAADK